MSPLFFVLRLGVSTLQHAYIEAWYLACSTTAAPIYSTDLTDLRARNLHTLQVTMVSRQLRQETKVPRVIPLSGQAARQSSGV